MGELDLNNEIESEENDDSLLNEEGDLIDNEYSDLVMKLLQIRNSMK